MKDYRYILEAIQLLQAKKVKKPKIPIWHTVLDVVLALVVYGIASLILHFLWLKIR